MFCFIVQLPYSWIPLRNVWVPSFPKLGGSHRGPFDACIRKEDINQEDDSNTLLDLFMKEGIPPHCNDSLGLPSDKWRWVGPWIIDRWQNL